jgi:hypothetical protein
MIRYIRLLQTVGLKQHGLRSPPLSFVNAVSIRRLRVSDCLVEPIQRIQSQRAPGVISIHKVCACITRPYTYSCKPVGTIIE